MPTKYCMNIPVDERLLAEDGMDLLEHIKAQAHAENAADYVTQIPHENDTQDVLVVSVRAKRNVPMTKAMVVDRAREKIDQWILDYPEKGLPFFRSNIYQKFTTIHNTDIPQTLYVNIEFSHDDHTLSDKHLLHFIDRWICARDIEELVTPEPMDKYASHILSMKLDLSNTSPRYMVVQDMAEYISDKWIKEYPETGLPFDRNRLFSPK